MKSERQLVKGIKMQQDKQIGDILRKDTLLNVVLEGRYPSKPGRGGKRDAFLDHLKDGKRYKLKRTAEHWHEWKSQLPWTYKEEADDERERDIDRQTYLTL